MISSGNQEELVTLLAKQVGHRWTIIVSFLATLLGKDGKVVKFNALTWPCHIIEEERSKN